MSFNDSNLSVCKLPTSTVYIQIFEVKHLPCSHCDLICSKSTHHNYYRSKLIFKLYVYLHLRPTTNGPSSIELENSMFIWE